MKEDSKESGTPARKFKVDARVLLSLGRESIKDQTTALMELVKNAYDADANHVQIEIPVQSDSDQVLKIKDDGVGMTSQDINDKWLRIGYSHKRENRTSDKGRRATGEKGVGRLSADRLGAGFELRSRSKAGVVAVSVNWDDFDVDGTELGAIAVIDVPGVSPELPVRSPHQNHGTELVISKLRQPWSDEEIDSLEVELSTLVPPNTLKGDGFSIWMRRGQDGALEGLEPPFAGDSQLEFNGDFDSSGRLSYRVSEKPVGNGARRHQIRQGKIPWVQLSGTKEVPLYTVGRISVSLKFYLRSGMSLKNLRMSDLRDYLDTYGGVRIYRDNVRVKPYGDPSHAEGDWLGLSARKAANPAAASRKDFRISANQLVGSVFIGRDTNPLLKDSAAREGLVLGAGYSQLRAAVFACVTVLETIYHERFVSAKTQQPENEDSLPDVVGDIKAGLKEVREELARAGQSSSGSTAANTSRLLLSSAEKIDGIAKRILQAEREIEDLAGQATVYRGLATVGISSAVFGHETESSLAQAKLSSGLAAKLLNRDVPKIAASIDEMGKASRAIERVSVWGQFALARVKKDKRRRIKLDVCKIVAALVEEMRPLFAGSTIELTSTINGVLEMRAFQMDIEALTLNLLTNAYYAAGRSKKNRKVHVQVAPGVTSGTLILSVEDSGPGIAKEHLSQIWTPLFSTRTDDKGKSTGTGLGLSIVQSIAKELKATCTVTGHAAALGGAKFEVEIPMGGGKNG